MPLSLEYKLHKGRNRLYLQNCTVSQSIKPGMCLFLLATIFQKIIWRPCSVQGFQERDMSMTTNKIPKVPSCVAYILISRGKKKKR